MATTITAGNGTNGGAGISSDTTGILEIRTGTTSGAGTTAMTVDASQNVGIGTSSPGTKLNVQTAGADVEIRASATTSGDVRIGFDATGAFYNWIQTQRSSGAMQFAIANTERMRIDSTGNVGIGTAAPANRLHVQRAAGANFQGEAYLTDGTQWILQNSNNSAGSYNPIFQTNDSCFVYSNGTQNNGAFAIGQWSSSPRGIRIDGTGNFQFNSGYGSVATAYGCRAWVNFNGTGTVAIRASGNVSSITDNGNGDYTVNFTTAISDTNYCIVFGSVLASTTSATGSAGVYGTFAAGASTKTTSAIRTMFGNSSSGVATDTAEANIAVFR